MRNENTDTSIVSQSKDNIQDTDNNSGVFEANNHKDLTNPRHKNVEHNTISEIDGFKVVQTIDGTKPHPLGEQPNVVSEFLHTPDSKKLRLEIAHGKVKYKEQVDKETERLLILEPTLDLSCELLGSLLGKDYEHELSDLPAKFSDDEANYSDKSEKRVAALEGNYFPSEKNTRDFIGNAKLRKAFGTQIDSINDISLLRNYHEELLNKMITTRDAFSTFDINLDLDLAAKTDREWSTAKLLCFHETFEQFYFYDVAKGVYQEVSNGEIFSDILSTVKRILRGYYLDQAKLYETTKKDEKGEEYFFRPYKWLEHYTPAQMLRLAEKCDWMVKDASYLASKTLELLKLSREFTICKKLKGKQTRYINVLNGVVDVNTKELLPHSPYYEFTYVLPGNYLVDNPDVEPKVTLEFLNGAMKNANERIPFLRACILEGMKGRLSTVYQIFLEFTGQAGAGKGTLQLIIDLLMGEGNYYPCTLPGLSDKWTAFNIKDKLHIHVDDAPAIVTSRDILTITSGGMINAEAKMIQKTEAINFSGILTISSNKLTVLKNSSVDEYERRRQPFYFNKNEAFFDRTFLDNETGEWTGEITNELDELITWVISQDNKAVDELIRTTKRSSTAGDVAGLLSAYPILRFMDESLIYKEGEFVPCKLVAGTSDSDDRFSDLPIDLFSSYINWCKYNNQKAVNSNNFVTEVKAILTQKALNELDIEWIKWRKAPFRDKRGLSNVALRSSLSTDHEHEPSLLEHLMPDED